jgi:hypothetical protein
MPEETRTPRPQMHGITPTPYEIPKERLAKSNRREKKRPWLITLFVLNNFVHSVFYLLLALVPWSDPDSDLATTLLAHPKLVFGILPKMVQPSASAMALTGETINHVLPGLPVIFLIFGIVYALLGWRLYDMDPWWYFVIRWSMMFNSGYIVVKLMIAISADYVVASGPRMVSEAALVYLLPAIGWNLLIFCYFAMMPDVAKAYDEAA